MMETDTVCETSDTNSTLTRLIACEDVIVSEFLTSTIDGGEWSASRSGHFIPGIEARDPSYRRLGGPRSRSGLFVMYKHLLPHAGI
jgi:hypothetical protein